MRTTTLNKSIKWVALISVYLAVFMNMPPVLAMSKVVDGVGLKEPIEIELDFSESDYLLVTASQSHADYSLTLKDRLDPNFDRRVDVDSKSVPDEVFLVNIRDCEKCFISIYAKAKVDQFSPYKLVVTPIDLTNASLVKTLSHITNAAENSYLASTGDEKLKKASLLKVVGELKSAADVNDQVWRNYSLILLSSTFFVLEDLDSYRTILETLISETEGKPSYYRVSALYGLAEISSNTKEIFDLFDEGLELAKQLGNDNLIARGYDAKGIVLVFEAQYEAAIESIKAAKAIYSKNLRWRLLLSSLHNLSWAYMRAGNLPASIAAASEQQLTAERYSFEEHALWALYNFGLAYGQSGDRAVADGFLDEALFRIEKLPLRERSPTSKQLKAFLLLEKTQRSLEFGAMDIASDYAKSAKKQFEKLGQPGQVANVNFIQGEVALRSGDFDLAQSKFIETISFDKNNNRNRSAGIHLLSLADLKMTQKQYVDASQHQAEALKILSATQDYWAIAKAFSQAIYLLHKLGANEDASSLASRTSDFIHLHGLDRDRARLEYRRALIEQALGNNRSSMRHLNSARSMIENTLPRVFRKDLRQTYLSLQKSVFELNVQLLLAQDDAPISRSLSLAETFKGRTIEESIRALDSNQFVDTKQLAQRSEILKKIQKNALNWHKGGLGVRSDSTILSETRALSRDLEKLEADIKASRDSGATTVLKVDNLTLPRANPKELIAYYFTGTESSWLWVIVESGTYVYSLSSEKHIEGLVEDAMSHMVVTPSNRKGSNAWQQLSSIEELSKEILSPLAAHVSDNDISLITIIPDGVLHALPFAPLALPGQKRPLIADYAIAYAPSLYAREALGNRSQSKRIGNKLKALIVADPISSENSELSLSRLEHSREEADVVSSMVGDDVVLLVAEKADKESFLEHLEQPFNIMHFATHGLLNSQEPALSGLLFSSTDNAASLWLAPEISRSDISADLVVLSACDSSIGKHLSGEGLFSLSRAFIEGGANQVLGTLWKVEDRATAELMRLFYSNFINEDMGVAEALRKAQKAIYLDKNNDWNDPYFWAGFQLQGGGANQTYASSKGI